MAVKITRAHRLMCVIVGFYTHSLALVADAFHYLNDLVSFIVALIALKVSERENSPRELSFGWQRAQLLGAFFNGVFLFALGISIFLQALERFVSLQKVERPDLVLIIGCVGLVLNIISVLILHESEEKPTTSEVPAVEGNGSTQLAQPTNSHSEHRHNASSPKSPGRDLGMLGVLVHIIGDAINNIGVIIAAVVIWKAHYEGRFYADPAVSVGIAIMILVSSIPIIKSSGSILLQSVPLGVNLEDVKYDLEKVDGVTSVHELHAWRLSQDKAIATAHIVTSDDSLTKFISSAKRMNECLHAYGIHSITIQPELAPLITDDAKTAVEEGTPSLRQRIAAGAGSNNCSMICGNLCEPLQCCN
ncbi:hypothetical protein G7Y89_g8905 [Cudoniella acicularis]|uniref:Cation efflux protein n=1 Tax=Cudoniella acicularis TaxID=354080 RepID=A0A8H4RHZ9_9HELO|nr:hypothetical protein G7Y89_g8905 [Cudoniella acicularis]